MFFFAEDGPGNPGPLVCRGWTAFFVYGVLPIWTVVQLMIRWIDVAEHKYNIEYGTVIETTPIIELTWWQKLLFPDLNFGYHA